MMHMLSSFSSLIVENGVFDPLGNLKYLVLSGNRIQHLPVGVFQNNKNLEVLDLSWNLLKQTIFEARFLFNLNKLRIIALAFNGNCQSPVSTEVLRLGKAFSSFFSIESLLIGNYFDSQGFAEASVQFDKIDNQSFSNLSNLTHLSTIDISHCNVGHISSDAWSGLRHLKSIRASNNLLTFNNKSFSETIITTLQRKLPKDQSTFPHPVINDRKKDQLSDRKKSLCDESGSLEYSNNRITTLSENKFFLSSTTMLDLSNNQIREIRSDDLKHLTNLCWIDLSNNPLQTIDHFTFSSLSNLKAIFFINDHQLSNFDFSFLCHFSISARIQLFWKLEGNDLALVLDSWHERNKCEIRSLLALDASHNIMTETWFPYKMNILQIMPDLVLLDFSYSGLQNVFIDHGTLVLTNLEYLYMIHNHLVTIPSTALRSTTRLRVLRLDYNNIVELKGNLSFLVHLKEFTIAHNNIRFIQSGFFSLLKLEVLVLSHNFISRLDPSIFDKVMLDSLLYLDIRGNDLDCFCHDWEKFYRWFITDASYSTKLPGFFPRCTLEMDKYYGGCVACHSPLNLRGRSISRFGFNTSCDLQTDFKYTIAFTIFFILFMLCGTIGYSKWFKRLIFRKVNEYFRVQALKPGDVSSCSSTNKIAFVFFDHNNNELGDWVDNKLVPGMINGNPSIELLLAGRDVDAGAAPNENLLRLITKSRKTIVIFSGNFCNTPICR
ncbi:toll-like receptor 8 [Clavelina lepadiformis]|uniref:toll-like receptor 8 n=1 Tax=Clavelina lepadiformis TaxID=159417 RepID=UPI00404354DD